jgi:hypothetical protein
LTYPPETPCKQCELHYELPTSNLLVPQHAFSKYHENHSTGYCTLYRPSTLHVKALRSPESATTMFNHLLGETYAKFVAIPPPTHHPHASTKLQIEGTNRAVYNNWTLLTTDQA